MAYIGKTPSSGIRNRFIYTATAGQTTFSGTDDHSRTLSYTDAEFTDVFLNGVKLDKSDYTATSGTSIVLDEGAAVDDTLEVLAFDTFSVFSGEFSQDVTVGGATTMTGDLTVDTDTLFVDSTNDRLGINQSSPTAPLHIKLNSNLTEDIFKFQRNDGAVAGVLNYNGTDGAISLGTTTSHDFTFDTASTERMRIDSSGSLNVARTGYTSLSTNGFHANASGWAHISTSGEQALYVNRNTSDGAIVQFSKDGTTVGSIGTYNGVSYYGGTAGGIMFNGTAINPTNGTATRTDNINDIGALSFRYDDIYATNGTIQTSDQNEKQQIASLTDAEITAAKAISKLFKTFKWNDKVEAKGDAARTHTGVIAQDVQQAMTDAGLDAGNYAFFISTTWWETQTEVPAVEAVEAQDAVYDEDGNIVTEAIEAVEAADAYTRTDTYDTAEEAPEGATERTRLGIRYPELLAFVGAATEQRLADIETRIAALEASD